MNETLPANDNLPADLIPFAKAARLLQASLGAVHRWRLANKFRAWRRCGRWFASEAELRALFVETEGRPARALPTNRQEKATARWVEEELKRHGLSGQK